MISTITDLYFPNFKLPSALHRRGNAFYVVFPRPYGMACGNKCFAQLNFPRSADPAPNPPPSQVHLNPRFWHREGGGDPFEMSFANLMGVEPAVFKDVGICRTVKVGKKEAKERLVEVLIKEEEYCQRCAWCGRWEYSYERSAKHQREEEPKGCRVLYWCGVSLLCMGCGDWLILAQECSKKAKWWSRYRWQNPESLAHSVYFFCELP
jgi:hypothetical protein